METKKTTCQLDRREFLSTTIKGCAAIGLAQLGFPSIVFPKTAIKIGYLPILDHLAFMVAHARDNANYKNISVEPKLFKSWDAAAGALKAGVVDGALLLSNFAMNQFNQGVDIRSILVGHRHGSGITVKKDSAIKDAKDLEGKTIGIPAAISTHTTLLDIYLRSAGLSLAKVKTSIIAPTSMLNALKEGHVDAYIVAEPFCAAAEVDGSGRILVLSKDILQNHICCIVTMKADIIKANPEGMKELVNSIVANGKFIDQDKVDNGAKNIVPLVSKYMPQPAPVVLAGLVTPSDRITYSDLEPRIEDYQKILDASKQAGIMKDVDLAKFVDGNYFTKA